MENLWRNTMEKPGGEGVGALYGVALNLFPRYIVLSIPWRVGSPLPERRVLAARVDLADKLKALAESRGVTVYSMLNDILESVLEIEEAGLSIRRLIDEHRSVDYGRSVGFTPIPETLLYELVDLCFELGFSERLRRSWFETGLWLSKYIAVSSSIDESVSILRSLIWNISEFRFERRGGEAVLLCFSSRSTLNYSLLLESLLRGVLEGLGFKVMGSEVDKGFIRIRVEVSDGYAIPPPG
jgi:hypothetical protein